MLEFTLRGDSSNVSGTFFVGSAGPLLFNNLTQLGIPMSFGAYETKKVVVGMRATGNSSSLVDASYGFRYGSGMFEQVIDSKFLVNISGTNHSNMSIVVNVSTPAPVKSTSSKSSGSKSTPVIDQGKPVQNASVPAVSPPVSQPSSSSDGIAQDIAGQDSGIANMIVGDSGPPDGMPIRNREVVVDSSTKGAITRTPPIVLLLFILALLMMIVLQVATIRVISHMEG
jgi:hypothetical protein